MRQMENKMSKVQVIYNPKRGYITYQRGKLTISTILICYDDILRVVDFHNGLLTALMKRGNKEIEEYIDFSYALSLLSLSNQKKQYFEGISTTEIELSKE